MKKKTTYRKNVITFTLLYLTILSFLPILLAQNEDNISISPNNSAVGQGTEDSVLWNLLFDIPGDIPYTDPLITNFTNGGDQYIIIGTDGGIGIIDIEGVYVASYLTSGSVIDIKIIDDVSGDLESDILIITLDQDHANVYAISSNNCSEIWRFETIIEGFSEDTFLTQNFITYTWDSVIVNDLDSDGVNDIIVSSWYRLFAINGLNGSEIWKMEDDEIISDDIWVLDVLEDINSNGFEEVVAGTEDGEVVVIDSSTHLKIWDFTIPDTVLLTRNMYGVMENKSIQLSVADLMVIPDISDDADDLDDILVAGDNSYLYLLSSSNSIVDDEERVIGNQSIFVNGLPNDNPIYLYTDTEIELYDYEERFLEMDGIEIKETYDITGDGNNEIVTQATGLDGFESSMGGGMYSNQILTNTIFNISGLAADSHLNNISSISVELSYMVVDSISDFCYIEVNSEDRAYTMIGSSMISLGYVNITDSEMTGGDTAATFSAAGSEDNYKVCLINAGDINSDGTDDLFGLIEDGQYFIFDPLNEEFIWRKTKTSASSVHINEINDINGDLVKEVLFEFPIPLDAEWLPSSINVNTSSVFVINAKTGNILWRFTPPTSDYNGISDIKNVGDISGDGIDDFAGWIIPNQIPDSVNSYLSAFTSDDLDDDSDSELLYRILLNNYTRMLLLYGNNGTIMKNYPLIENPYNFERYSTYTGDYLNPTPGIVNNPYYNRINGKIPLTWVDDYTNFNIQWGDPDWKIDPMLNTTNVNIPSEIENIGQLSDLWSEDDNNYTLKANNNGGTYEINASFTFQADLNSNNVLGSMEYELSQLERLSAIQMQTKLMVNETSPFYNFSYQLYNYSGSSWVNCDWNEGDNTWDDSEYPDLQGGWNSATRNHNKNFSFTGNYDMDSIYIGTRGIKAFDESVEFDYENTTTLSDFVDSSSKNLQVRIIVNNTNIPFNLTIDTFGLETFYWGLFSPRYDNCYIYDYIGSGSWTTDNILNAEITDFEAINGTGDQNLDILTISLDNLDGSTSDAERCSLHLFDLKNEQQYTRWGTNSTEFPIRDTEIMIIDNENITGWLLHAKYKNAGSSSYYYHIKRIGDMHWAEYDQSRLQNYTSTFSTINYLWEKEFSYTSFNPVLIDITTDGKKGILYNNVSSDIDYDPYQEYTIGNLIIYDPNYDQFITRSVFPLEDLFSVPGDASPASYCSEDFNNDGYLDHYAFYKPRSWEFDYNNPSMSVYLRTYDGTGNSSILKTLTYNLPMSESYQYSSSFEYGNSKLISVGDFDGDSISELVYAYGYYSYSGMAGSSMVTLNTENQESSNFQLEECTSYACTNPYYPPSIAFNSYFDTIGDINNDNFDEAYIKIETSEYDIGYNLIETLVTKIVDIKNQQILAKLKIEMDDIFMLQDSNADGNNEYIVASSGLVFCINSKFSVDFIEGTELIASQSDFFTLTWETEGLYSHFEVLINGNTHGPTQEKQAQIALSSGSKTIEVNMHDKSGIITAIDSFTVIVISPPTMWIVTIGSIVALVSIVIISKIRRKKQAKRVVSLSDTFMTSPNEKNENGGN